MEVINGCINEDGRPQLPLLNTLAVHALVSPMTHELVRVQGPPHQGGKSGWLQASDSEPCVA